MELKQNRWQVKNNGEIFFFPNVFDDISIILVPFPQPLSIDSFLLDTNHSPGLCSLSVLVHL